MPVSARFKRHVHERNYAGIFKPVIDQESQCTAFAAFVGDKNVVGFSFIKQGERSMS